MHRFFAIYQVTQVMVVATSAIVAGNILVVIFAEHAPQEYSIENIEHLYTYLDYQVGAEIASRPRERQRTTLSRWPDGFTRSPFVGTLLAGVLVRCGRTLAYLPRRVYAVHDGGDRSQDPLRE